MRSLGRFDCPYLCRNCVPVENKTAACIAASGCLSSGTSGNRTSDTRIFSPLLYQLSYGTIVSGGCRSLLQTLRAIAMLCLTRCECKGKQKSQHPNVSAVFCILSLSGLSTVLCLIYMIMFVSVCYAIFYVKYAGVARFPVEADSGYNVCEGRGCGIGKGRARSIHDVIPKLARSKKSV